MALHRLRTCQPEGQVLFSSSCVTNPPDSPQHINLNLTPFTTNLPQFHFRSNYQRVCDLCHVSSFRLSLRSGSCSDFGVLQQGWNGRAGFEIMALAPVTDCGEVELDLAEEFGKGEKVENGKNRRVKAVFFDLDDTLVLTHAADKVAQEAVQALAERQCPHVNGAEMVKVFVQKFDVSPWDPTHQVDVLEWRARIWGEALQSQGIEDMELARAMQSLFDKERMLSFQWAPGVEALVRSLHKAGVKVGIITNGHFSVQRTKLKACKADLLFDTILVGGEEPKQKPHRDIFMKACKLAGCIPEETIMVGDNLKTDIQGGMNAGFLATVWVNVHNLEGVPAGGAEPDFILSNIGELRELLKTLKVALDNSDS